MKPFRFLLLLTVLPTVPALAGPNVAGVLAVHDANLAYTADVSSSYCGLGVTPDSCGVIDVEVESSGPDNQRVWKVYAVFPDTASPRLKAVTFGIQYSPDSLVVSNYGPCVGDLNNGAAEFPGSGWPGTDTGTTLVFETTRTDRLVECYWFAGYDYTAGEALFRVGANPCQHR